MAKGSLARSRVERVFREEAVGREPNLSMDTTNALMILEFVKMGMGEGIGSFVTEVPLGGGSRRGTSRASSAASGW